MREDKLIFLDNSFPNGYVVVYQDADGQLRLTLYNPHADKVFQEVYDKLIEMSDSWEKT